LAFYRGSDCCVLVYDINDPISVDNLERWINFFNEECNIKDNTFPVVVIGNKIDQKTEVSDAVIEKAKEWCERKHFQHFESSAKEGSNVETIFIIIAKTLFQANPRTMDNLYEESSLITKDPPEQKTQKGTGQLKVVGGNQPVQQEKEGCC